MSHRSRNVTIAILVLVAWAGFGVPAGARAQSGAASGSPDGLWRAVEPEVHALAAGPQRPPDWRGPDVFGLFTLQPDVLRRRLAGSKPHTLAAPKGAAAAVELSIPMPDGSFPRFRIEESAVLAPELAARYPALRTYRGQGIDDPTATVQITLESKTGGTAFRAQVLASSGGNLVEPYLPARNLYASFARRAPAAVAKPFQCGVQGRSAAPAAAAAAPPPRSGGVLRTYRLAVAATSAYSARFGGTVAGAFAGIVTTVARVSGIYERELGIALQLVPGTDRLIVTDPAKDTFSNDDAQQLIDQSQQVIDRVIGPANYDIGHTFSTGAGGLAGVGVVCRDGVKAQGVTGSSNPVGDGFDVDYVAHEMGHQFGADHTFNGVLGSCGAPNRNPATAYEPGSGSTILAYAGICGADDLQESSNPYFHSASLQEILAYVAGDGNCGKSSANGHAPPEVTAGAPRVVPRGTPFVLVATGKDPDGHALTYCWEEADLGPAATISAPDDGKIPLFRSLPPDRSPARSFPRLPDLLGSAPARGELLPQRGRTLVFRVTARDSLGDGGGVSFDQVSVEVDGTSGPFRVTSPAAGSVSPGPLAVTWDVAGTDKAPVKAEFVNIWLSTDGGLTYAVPLALNARNSGSVTVSLPSIATPAARIKIESAGNIFFALSPVSFAIALPAPASAAATGVHGGQR